MLARLIPNIFYANMQDGVDLFVEAWLSNCSIATAGSPCWSAVPRRPIAARDRPEIAIETDAIEDLYAESQGMDGRGGIRLASIEQLAKDLNEAAIRDDRTR